MPAIRQDAGVWIRERIGCRLEAHSVLLYVDSGLTLVPFEFYVTVLNHTDMIHIQYICVKLYLAGQSRYRVAELFCL